MIALAMVWSGLEGFMAGVLAGFEGPGDEEPPDSPNTE
jgi:hypothetical protein